MTRGVKGMDLTWVTLLSPDTLNISFTYSCFCLPWQHFPCPQSSYWTNSVVTWDSCSILSLGLTLSLVGYGVDLVIQQVCCLKHYPEHINTNKGLTCSQALLSQWTVKGVYPLKGPAASTP